VPRRHRPPASRPRVSIDTTARSVPSVSRVARPRDGARRPGDAPLSWTDLTIPVTQCWPATSAASAPASPANASSSGGLPRPTAAHQDDGQAWSQGSWLTAALWIVSPARHLGNDILVAHGSGANGLGTATIVLYLAVSLGFQPLSRAVRARGGRGSLTNAGRRSDCWLPSSADSRWSEVGAGCGRAEGPAQLGVRNARMSLPAMRATAPGRARRSPLARAARSSWRL